MKRFRLTLLMIAFLGVFSACNKDDDAAPATKADILAGKTWKRSASTISPAFQLQNGEVVSDLYTFFGSCYQDDFVRFTRNPNTYIQEEGPTTCDPTDPQVTDTGSWLLNSDETTLVLSSTTGRQSSYKLEELTATTLKYSFATRFQGSNQVYTFTETYTAQ